MFLDKHTVRSIQPGIIVLVIIKKYTAALTFNCSIFAAGLGNGCRMHSTSNYDFRDFRVRLDSRACSLCNTLACVSGKASKTVEWRNKKQGFGRPQTFIKDVQLLLFQVN